MYCPSKCYVIRITSKVPITIQLVIYHLCIITALLNDAAFLPRFLNHHSWNRAVTFHSSRPCAN